MARSAVAAMPGAWAATLVAAVLALPLAHAAVDVAANARPDAGGRIYVDGVLDTGSPLRGLRANQTVVEGASAACANCHRRSGLGTVEGQFLVPPITAKYLTRSASANAGDLEMAHVEGYHQGHVPYSEEALARALREGIASDGRRLNDLMPRYDLDPPAMAQLQSYLRQLGVGPFPGVSDTELQFATVVTPDADPVERSAMLEVIERFFAVQSEVIAAETRPMRASREINYRVTRRWKLHVWELTGRPDTWEKQLDQHFAVEPVFAVVSGIGRHTWAPVHDFCEHSKVPCLFPNVDLPVVHESDFYPVYFSRGVLLEAGLLARWFTDQRNTIQVKRLVQVYRHADVGAAAASALAATVRAAGLEVIERELPERASAGELARAVADLGAGDSLMLWLRARDLESLPQAPPPVTQLLVSGLMGGLDSAPLPSAWRALAHLSYPVDLPERRLARMNFPYGWFRVQHIPIVAERVQIDTYLACVITSETLTHMLDSFVPEFLVERMEMMVSRRLANAYFPRLGLAPGQRFASKGGFIVHFDASSVPTALPATADARAYRGMRVVADTDWLVPDR